MTDIDQLTGVELRRAVAEAVGWEWRKRAWIGWSAVDAERTIYLDEHHKVTWDDAMAAIEAARPLGVVLTMKLELVDQMDPLRRQLHEEAPTLGVDISIPPMSTADGSESLLRALLHALASRDPQQPHVAEEGEAL